MKIAVILGSTRQARKGERVAQWAMSQLESNGEVEYELRDL